MITLIKALSRLMQYELHQNSHEICMLPRTPPHPQHRELSVTLRAPLSLPNQSTQSIRIYASKVVSTR